jgi:hypothetical protein
VTDNPQGDQVLRIAATRARSHAAARLVLMEQAEAQLWWESCSGAPLWLEQVTESSSMCFDPGPVASWSVSWSVSWSKRQALWSPSPWCGATSVSRSLERDR